MKERPRAVGWLLALSPVALAAAAMMFPWSGRRGAPPKAAAPLASSSARQAAAAIADLSTGPSKACTDRFLAPFEGFAGRETEQLVDAGSPASEPGAEGTWTAIVARAKKDLESTMGEGATLEVRIATVPDPIDAGLQYHFDSVIQAIELGAEHGRVDDQGRVHRRFRDRSWLPWDDRAVDARERVVSEACRRTTPGVILFRGGGVTRDVLALLLVGESPTVGVHPTTMKRALEAAATLRAWASPVQVLGPTYSGSAGSLRLAILQRSEWVSAPHEVPSVHVVTGSASGSDVPTILRDPPRITFEATTVAARSRECVLLHFLAEQIGDGSPLAGVAFLHESGTEFGAVGDRDAVQDRDPASRASCPLAANRDFRFPFHVSALRDAYEDLERSQKAPAGNDDAVSMRPTSLDVSLREPHPPLDVEAPPSQKTMNGEDVALSRILTEISHGGIRYVGIEATDVADAIFLARRIRDLAPDVRLAFLSADALLMHPAFNDDLFGSLVVSPYPFLGADDVSFQGDREWEAAEHEHVAFESEMGEGVFQAMLALDGRPPAPPRKNALPDPSKPVPSLPLWISTIGRSEIVPVALRLPLDDTATGYGAEPGSAGRSPIVDPAYGPPANVVELHVDPDVTPPKLWHFTFAVLALGACADRWRQRRARIEMSIDAPLPDLGAAPLEADAHLDRMLGRARWCLYAVVRGLLLFSLLFYMTSIQALAVLAFARQATAGLPALALAVGVLATFLTARSVVHSGKDLWKWRGALRAFLTAHGEPPRAARGVLGLLSSLASRLGLADLPGSGATYEVVAGSYAELHTLGACVLLTFVAVGLMFFDKLWEHDFGVWLLSWPHGGFSHVVPATTLFVLRSLPLVNGVSPAAPWMFAMICAYVWVVGRMTRLRLVCSLSALSPASTVVAAMSTPITAVLSPRRAPVHARGRRPAELGSAPEPPGPLSTQSPGPLEPAAAAGDIGLSRIERALVSSIRRPSTGPGYLAGLLVILFFPVVLFFLKQPTTVDGRPYLFFSSLCLCLVLIGTTLIQLVQYWLALEQLLKRIMGHPLGRGFGSVGPFVREPLDDLISRSPNDVLRLAGCARQFEELVIAGRSRQIEIMPAALADLEGDVRLARESALHESADAGGKSIAKAEALGQHVLRAATMVVELLDRAWQGTAPPARASGSDSHPQARPPAEARKETGRDGGSAPKPPGPDGDGGEGEGRGGEARQEPDALTAVEGLYLADELAWLRLAQSFAATVVAVLVNRHVRQFRYFLYVLTGCALLLVAAFVTYPFEPHRLLITCIWVVMSSVVASSFWIFVQMDRSTLLSRVSGTTPGELTIDAAFVLRVITWGVIPLLSVAAAQYPELASPLFRWLTPLSRALR